MIPVTFISPRPRDPKNDPGDEAMCPIAAFKVGTKVWLLRDAQVIHATAMQTAFIQSCFDSNDHDD